MAQSGHRVRATSRYSLVRLGEASTAKSDAGTRKPSKTASGLDGHRETGRLTKKQERFNGQSHQGFSKLQRECELGGQRKGSAEEGLAPMERWKMETWKESPWNDLNEVVLDKMVEINDDPAFWRLDIEDETDDGTWCPTRRNDEDTSGGVGTEKGKQEANADKGKRAKSLNRASTS